MNAEASHRVVFKGRTSPDFSDDALKRNASLIFRKNIDEIEPYLSGREILLKSKVSSAGAQKLASQLAKHGLLVEIEPALIEDFSAVDIVEPKPELPLENRVVSVSTLKSEEKPVELPRRAQKLRYAFDSFMAQGGASTFKALMIVFLCFFLLLAGARGLLYVLSPELAQQYGELDFFGNIYVTFLQLTDPGNMAQDILSSPWYKVFSVMAGLAGVILLSALIAVITNALDQKIHELKRGRSKVVESGHTLILGWNEQRITEVVRELVLANESEKDACVVILADRDKEEMDDILRLRLSSTLTTRIVTRSGQVSTLANLDMVSIETCKSVVILAACEDTASDDDKAASDARVIQTILACDGRVARDDEFCVVAEIYNSAYRDIVEGTFSEHIVTVDTSDILAKLLVQTSRSVGLSIVYNEILSFDGCEMYFYHSDWNGIKFSDLIYRFPDGVPLGVRHGNGEIYLRPESDYCLRDDDDILIVADDDSTIEMLSKPVASPKPLDLPSRRLEQVIERELVIGWNHKAPIILAEFAEYVCAGSQINILLKAPTPAQKKEISELNSRFQHVEINIFEGDCLNRDHLLDLKPFTYNNIIILADGMAGGDAALVDSANIVCLLLLRSIFNEHLDISQNTKLITEVLDSQNYSLVARAGVKDVIISNRLVSMIIAQVSESKDIKQVYDDIFSEDGSEIYLKPASLYFDTFPVDVSFADLMGLAQSRDEICIGLKIHANENNSERNNGVELIPEKLTRYTLNKEDNLVVLSEDEL